MFLLLTSLQHFVIQEVGDKMGEKNKHKAAVFLYIYLRKKNCL